MKIQRVGKLYKITTLDDKGKSIELTLTKVELGQWFDRIGQMVIGAEGISLED